MAMNNEPDALARALAAIDDQMLADIKRELAAGQVEPEDPNDLIDDGPDPLGINFAWAGASLPTEAESPPAPSLPTVVERAQPAGLSQRVKFGLGIAIAASLIIGLAVFLMGRTRDRGPETFALTVEPTKIQFFGTERPQPTFKSSPMDGFISAVSVTRAGEVRVWPSEGDRPGAPIPIRKNDPARIGPFTEPVEYVVVVVTEQPATAALLQEFARKKIPNDQRSELEKRITIVLRGQNYRSLALGRVEYQVEP